MGWIFPIVFIMLAFAVLWRLGKLSTPALQVSGATLMIAVMGYAWQGSPNLGSTPARALTAAQTIDTSAAISRPLKPAFTREDMALNTAEALIREHNTIGAVSLLQDEIKGAPHSPMLWNGLGNALIAHDNGVMSPAAEFAFERARALIGQENTGK